MVLRVAFLALTVAGGIFTILQSSSYIGFSSEGPFIRGWITTASLSGSEQILPFSPEEQMKVYALDNRKLVMVEFTSLSAMMQLKYLGYLLFQQIPWLLGIFVLYQMFLLFRDMDRGVVFPLENVRRIRRIAAAALLYPVAQYGSGTFLWNIVQTRYGQSDSFVRSPLFLEPVALSAFVALVLFGLAEVFQTGAKLQQEQDLTI